MAFACIFVPAFPVSAVVRVEPDLRGLAVAVVEGAPPQLVVAAANAPARTAGVEAGMTELEALGHLPSLIVRRRSPKLEAAAQAALLWLAQSVSPRLEATVADTVLLDLSGLDRLLGPPARLARELEQRVAALDLEANIGVAANPDAALHAARGFAGITVIPAGREAEHLGGLPLDILLMPHSKNDAAEDGCATQILETLDRWGVRSFRALAALPEVAVSERLGEEGLRLQKLARGAGSRELQPPQEDLQFEETLELESAVENLEPLAFVLSRLLEQLCSRLKAHARAAQELRVTLELDLPRRHGNTEEIQVSGVGYQVSGPENLKRDTRDLMPATPVSQRLRGETDSKLETGNSKLHERTLRLPVPLADTRVLLKLLQLDLASHPPPAAVVKITLRAEAARPRVRQNGLFLPLAPQPEKLEPVLARLAAAGAENVGSPQLLDTHRPGAFRMTRFDPDSPRRHGDTEKIQVSGGGHQVPDPGSLKPDTRDLKPATSVSPCLRGELQTRAPLLALRLFRPPRAARVETRDGRPRRVAGDGIRGTVVWLAGPWRSSGDWWQQPAEHSFTDHPSAGPPPVNPASANGASGSASGASAGAAPWAREEWDVALHADDAKDEESSRGLALYRIFHDLVRGKWFVEGEYD